MPGSREDDFYKKNAFPPYDLYGPSVRTPVQGVMKVIILVNPSWLFFFLQFYSFYQKLPSLGDGGHEIYNFLSPYPTDATYQIRLRLAQ